jgi:hypothetical protein
VRPSLRRPRPWIIATSALTVLVVAAALFQPWKLFVDVEVRDADPIATRTLVEGRFAGLAHPTGGVARLGSAADGSTRLFLDDLRTDNGPTLRVYLSRQPADGDAARHGDDALDLGDLKGNIGDQAYAVPAGADLSAYRSAVIWCERFRVAFGAAPLNPAAGDRILT